MAIHRYIVRERKYMRSIFHREKYAETNYCIDQMSIVLCRSIGLHPPELHCARLASVIINIFSIGRILAAIDVLTFGCVCQHYFFTLSVNGLFVYIISGIISTSSNVYHFLIIRRPAMEVGRRLFCDEALALRHLWEEHILSILRQAIHRDGC